MHQVGAEMSFPSFFGFVPWRHHVEIVLRCNSGKRHWNRVLPDFCWSLEQALRLSEDKRKLNFYVNAVNDLIRIPDENPTIGLLICKDKDQTEVQWAFQGI